jgi:hypothetical protein
METLYFLLITLAGGILLLFLATGWSSYKEKKIPETPILFRWFVAGVVSTGLIAYTWIFGYGGDVGEIVQKIGEVMTLPEIESALSTETETKAESEKITVGFPKF